MFRLSHDVVQRLYAWLWDCIHLRRRPKNTVSSRCFLDSWSFPMMLSKKLDALNLLFNIPNWILMIPSLHLQDEMPIDFWDSYLGDLSSDEISNSDGDCPNLPMPSGVPNRSQDWAVLYPWVYYTPLPLWRPAIGLDKLCFLFCLLFLLSILKKSAYYSSLVYPLFQFKCHFHSEKAIYLFVIIALHLL